MIPFPTKELSNHRIASKHLLAVRRAATVAEASTSVQCGTYNTGICDRIFVRLARQQTELQSAVLTTELKFLDLLGEMDKEDKYDTMFSLFDKDGSDGVDLEELAEGMRRISHMPVVGGVVVDIMPIAKRAFKKFDTDPDGLLEKEEFQRLLDSLHHSLDCSFHDFCCLLVMKIAFKESGKSILESSLLQVLEADKKRVKSGLLGQQKMKSSQSDLQEVIMETRLCLLFDMMDEKQNGLVKFQDVIQHIFRYMDDVKGSVAMKEEVETILARGLAHEATTTPHHHYQPQMMNFSQFSEFVLRVGQAFGPNNVDFNTLANRFTMSFCHAVDDANMERRLSLQVSAIKEPILEPLADEDKLAINGRLHRLFDLWDVDHSGKLDLGEFFLGMRKFEASSGRSIQDTVDGSLGALFAHDKDDDDHLDRHEFANLMQRYADAMEIDIHNLIDYMVVQSALRDVDEKDLEYLERVKRFRFASGGDVDEDGQPICQRATFVRVLRQTSSRLKEALHLDNNDDGSGSPTAQRKDRSERTDAFRKNRHQNHLHTMMATEKKNSSKGKSKPWFFQSGSSRSSS